MRISAFALFFLLCYNLHNSKEIYAGIGRSYEQAPSRSDFYGLAV